MNHMVFSVAKQHHFWQISVDVLVGTYIVTSYKGETSFLYQRLTFL